MDKGTILGVAESGQGVPVTSPQTSPRGAFVAPALLFVALLGGAMFFGLLAMSGKYEKDVATNNAAVTDPSPSKAAPTAKAVATHTPRATSDPAPSPSHTAGSEGPASARAISDPEEARQLASLPRKPIPGNTAAPVAGDVCSQPGATARTANGDRVVCEPAKTGGETHWRAR